MELQLFYGVQKLAIEVSGCAYRLDTEEFTFSPAERQFLLPDERQIYDLDISTPIPEGLSLCSHTISLNNQITDSVRALWSDVRVPSHCGGDKYGSLEAVYAEIEGESYRAPVVNEITRINDWLNLVQDLESLEDTVRMYPELSHPEVRTRWFDQFELLQEMIEAAQGFGVDITR